MNRLRSVLIPLLVALCIASIAKTVNLNHRVTMLELRVNRIEKEIKRLETRSRHNSRIIIQLLRRQ